MYFGFYVSRDCFAFKLAIFTGQLRGKIDAAVKNLCGAAKNLCGAARRPRLGPILLWDFGKLGIRVDLLREFQLLKSRPTSTTATDYTVTLTKAMSPNQPCDNKNNNGVRWQLVLLELLR